jgi:hypothetical protein
MKFGSEDLLKRVVKPDSYDILFRAQTRSAEIVGKASQTINSFLNAKKIDLNTICVVAVGSVGRCEALEASDIDLVPILKSSADLEKYRRHDKDMREAVAHAVGIKVSKGHDLTSATVLDELLEPENIGGEADTSAALTKRMLLLTESRQLAGKLELRDVRQKVLAAYEKERTSGRHVLSFFNDVARYYRTLCIEYKAKVEAHGKDWCTRNLKLRHSRKFWYFATLISVVVLAERHPRGSESFIQALLDQLELTPVERLVGAVGQEQPIEVGRALEKYAYFLEFMAKADNRKAIAKISHDKRYAISSDNHFPTMKFNSDLMHRHIIDIIKGLSRSNMQRVFDWFIL